jgi:hypothetical protein
MNARAPIERIEIAAAELRFCKLLSAAPSKIPARNSINSGFV